MSVGLFFKEKKKYEIIIKFSTYFDDVLESRSKWFSPEIMREGMKTKFIIKILSSGNNKDFFSSFPHSRSVKGQKKRNRKEEEEFVVAIIIVFIHIWILICFEYIKCNLSYFIPPLTHLFISPSYYFIISQSFYHRQSACLMRLVMKEIYIKK